MRNSGLLVFGGSGGIGAAIARLSAERGMAVTLTYSGNRAAAEKLRSDLRAANAQAEIVSCDVRDSSAIRRAFDVAQSFSRLRAVVFASGITGSASPLIEATDETLETVTAINLIGAMKVGRETVRRLGLSNGGTGGSLVFISSRASHYGSAGEYVWYAASKGGVDSLTAGLAREAAPEGLRVNAVSPGPIETPMISPDRQALGASRVPLQRVGLPSEVAEAVLFLASDSASYITGANLSVSGGV